MLCFCPFYFLSKLNTVLISTILLLQHAPSSHLIQNILFPLSSLKFDNTPRKWWSEPNKVYMQFNSLIDSIAFLPRWDDDAWKATPFLHIYPIINSCLWCFSYCQIALSTAVSQAFSLSNKYLCRELFFETV